MPISTIRSDSGTGSGRSSTLWTTEKSAVFAPMHKASVSAAVSVNALSFHSSRRPTRISELILDRREIQVPVFRGYSMRRACEGSTLAARQAGMMLAMAETPSSSADGAEPRHRIGWRRPRTSTPAIVAPTIAASSAADSEAGARHDQPLLHDEREDRAAARAERHPDANLLRPPRHRVGDDAVQADRRQQHRHPADAAHQPGARANREQRRAHLRLHRLVLDEDQVGFEREQFAAHVAQERRGVAARAGDDRRVRAWPLRARDLEKRRRRLAERQHLVIGGHADDLELGPSDTRDRNVLPTAL